VKTGDVPSGYVEDLNDARTTLAAFFSVLLGGQEEEGDGKHEIHPD
jgi:hypothetical protein